MADIELVIKIPDHLYKLLKEFPSDSNEASIENVLMKAVENGKPLPKGHGDLIDRNVAYEEFDEAGLCWEGGLLKYIPTVIPADKGELNNEDSN